jgi:membrane protease YdiL (CAAX protease family)
MAEAISKADATMRAMFRVLRPYLLALLMIWAGLGVAAVSFSHRYPAYSHWIMTGVLPAFLFEAVFFAAIGFEGARQLLIRIRPPAIQSLVLLASAILPFVIATSTAGTFDSHAFLLLFALCAVISFWWVVFPHRIAYDVAFLVIVAAVEILRVFGRLYISPAPALKLEVLGHLMWIRLALTALLLQRKLDAGPLGFWPAASEWKTGVVTFAAGIVPLCLIGSLFHFAAFAPQHLPPLTWAVLAAGYFFGTFWVVAFSEEIFFRGIILRGLLIWRHSPVAAVVISSILFGLVHLWYRDFPNWRFALVAAIAGVLYAIAYLRSGSVRASMVTHALVVTSWRMLFHS